MKAFAYVNPTNEKDAVAALRTDGIALPLAGGMDLIARMKDYIDSPDRVVNLKNALESSLEVDATSGPGMPSPFCKSSSFPTNTSTFSTIRPTTSTARS